MLIHLSPNIILNTKLQITTVCFKGNIYYKQPSRAVVFRLPPLHKSLASSTQFFILLGPFNMLLIVVLLIYYA